MFLNEFGAAVTNDAQNLERMLAPRLQEIRAFAEQATVDAQTWGALSACIQLGFERFPMAIDKGPLVDQAFGLGYEVYARFTDWRSGFTGTRTDKAVAYCYARLLLINELSDIALRKAAAAKAAKEAECWYMAKTGQCCGQHANCKCHVQA